MIIPTTPKTKSMAAIATYRVNPGYKLEILGYYQENCESYALVRTAGKKTTRRLLIKWNGHGEAYVSPTVAGRKERVYLCDCKKIVH